MGVVSKIATRITRQRLVRLSLPALQQRLQDRGGVTGLCYHAVSADYPEYAYTTSPNAFGDHLEFLAETFEILPLDVIVDLLLEGRTVDSGKPLAFLSFDDAYRNNLYTATPILEKFGLHATLFAPRDLVRGHNRTHMSEAELKEIAAHALWDLGGHSLTHNPLPALSPEDIRHELAESQSWLEDLTGQSITGFAYPLGAISNTVVESAREIYGFAASTDRSLAPKFDPLQIKRYCTVRSDDDLHTLAQSLLLGAHETG